jgi:hypothetical protein
LHHHNKQHSCIVQYNIVYENATCNTDAAFQCFFDVHKVNHMKALTAGLTPMHHFGTLIELHLNRAEAVIPGTGKRKLGKTTEQLLMKTPSWPYGGMRERTAVLA